jgi:hypothetical protein
MFCKITILNRIKTLKYFFLFFSVLTVCILLNTIELLSSGDRDVTLQQSWSTYYGGSSIDYAVGMASNASGDVVITGVTRSMNFPVTNGAFQTVNAGDSDLFIVKFNSLGQRLWSTYYGGSGSDEGRGVIIDREGNIVIIGVTNSLNFPVSPGAQQISNAGNYDAFILKFNSAGQRIWATFIGGSGDDRCMGITADNSGSFFITGYTNSNDFPVSPTAFQLNNAGFYDAFVVKINSNGQRKWSSYYGGSSLDAADGIAMCNNGKIIITGYSLSSDFPVSPGGFQTFNAGYTDAFFVSLDTAGSRMWATYYGGTDYDYGYGGISIDSNNNIFACGWTQSINFPVTSNAFQLSNAGGYDVYLLKFDNLGDRQWATYYGGSNDDKGEGVIADNSGNVFFTGYTNSLNFPVIPGTLQPVNAGGYDAFIVKFNKLGQRISGTYYGGVLEDLGHNISFTPDGSVLISGITLSTDFPVSSNCFQNQNAGLSDAFVSSLNGELIGINIIGENIPSEFNLYQNYPNPFNPSTKIKFQIPLSRGVSKGRGVLAKLIIYDILGREIAVLVNEQFRPGTYEVNWSATGGASNYPSGVYFYKLTAGDPSTGSEQSFTETRKMILLK